MVAEIDIMLQSAVSEVFKTMLSFEILPHPLDSFDLDGEPHVASSVGFTGQITGVVFVYCSLRFARRITSLLLGLHEDELDSDEMASDAMGELANMIVGHLKSRLADRGCPCVLTIPSTVRGTRFKIESSGSVNRRLNCFRCDQGQLLLLESLIKPNSTL